MKIQVFGTKSKEFMTYLQQYTAKYGSYIHSYDHIKSIDEDFADMMTHFANVCSQTYKPTLINFYQHTPWTEKRLHKYTVSKKHFNLLKIYYNLIGWKPDIIIYLFDLNATYDLNIEHCMDSDNFDGVKIIRLDSTDVNLHNAKAIINTIHAHYTFEKINDE